MSLVYPKDNIEVGGEEKGRDGDGEGEGEGEIEAGEEGDGRERDDAYVGREEDGYRGRGGRGGQEGEEGYGEGEYYGEEEEEVEDMRGYDFEDPH